MLGSNSVLLIVLLTYVTNSLTNGQKCGVINDNQQRIQMQGPPGKRAEVDYGKIKRIVNEAVTAEMASIIIEMGKIQTENRKLQTDNRMMQTENMKMKTENMEMKAEMLNFRYEMDEMKAMAKEIQKSEIPIILEDIVNDIMSGNDRNTSLQQLPKAFEAIPHTPNEVNDLAEKYEDEKKYIHSIILYYSAGMMDKSTGNTGVWYKKQRIQDIRLVGLKMKQEKRDFTVFKFWVIPLMEELLEQLRHITGASHEYKVLDQSRCLRDIGKWSYYLHDYENQFDKFKLCVDTMRQLGENANNYRIFAFCLHGSGAGLKNLGEYSEAVPYYEDAIKAYKSATDYSSELERQEHLALANEQLEDAKSEIGL